MDSEAPTEALPQCPLVLDDPAPDDRTGGTDLRAEFVARFTAELKRLAKALRGIEGWQAERLLSALGAAGVQEWELALAFLAAPRPTVQPTRHAMVPLETLRRRFEVLIRP